MQQAQQPQQKRQRDGDAGDFDVKQQAFGEQRGGFQMGLAADAAGHKVQEHQGAFGGEQDNNACPEDEELADLATVVSETGHGFRLPLGRNRDRIKLAMAPMAAHKMAISCTLTARGRVMSMYKLLTIAPIMLAIMLLAKLR